MITTSKGKELYQFIEKLYPINRSITGDGVRKTLSIISEIIPLKIIEISSGTRVFDWDIPNEWNIRDAWIKNSKGEKIVDFQKSNLHVLNYSTSINKKLSFSELKEHLFTNPEMPESIPYRTSYHNRNWGFCLPHNQFKNLGNETYEVIIDSSIEPGSLTYGEYFIEGKSKDEVLISTHICHPSLANDNLSGVAVAAFLANILSKTETRYSYRFLFVPVTIGSIAWLSQNEKNTTKIKHGLVLTLLGDESHFHYKCSRKSNTVIDQAMIKALNDLSVKFEIRQFSPYGYDERQYCSPGFNLPVGRISRKPHGEFPEYHTSADNLDFVKPDKLSESLDLINSVINILENNRIFKNTNPKGEPQLGRRGLFKKIGGASETKDYEMALLWILNLSDGDNSLLDIAVRSNLSFSLIFEAAKELEKVGLLKEQLYN